MRRRLAAIGVATAALLGPTLAAIQAGAPTAEAAPKPPPSPSVINHVVVMMQENRSSDHYLGQLHYEGQPKMEAEPPTASNPNPLDPNAPLTLAALADASPEQAQYVRDFFAPGRMPLGWP